MLVHVLKTEVILLNDVQVVEHLLKQVLTNGLFLQKRRNDTINENYNKRITKSKAFLILKNCVSDFHILMGYFYSFLVLSVLSVGFKAILLMCLH